MKKLFAIITVLLMILSLASCDDILSKLPVGDKTDGGNQTTDAGSVDISNIDFSAILAGNGSSSTVWGNQDAATKQAIIDAGKADGVDVSFGADGSMTVVDPAGGVTMVQKSDGTWVVKGDDGSEGQFGGEWPENEFTKLLPKPGFALTGASTNEDEFAVLFMSVSIEEIRDYVEKVKAKGFTLEAETADQEAMGMVIYSYTAKNASGYSVSVTFSAGVSGLVVEKP